MDVKKNIFILTGAGISKESGIQTFREKDGLWDNHRIEDVCTVDAFLKNPDYVNNFYNQRRKTLTEAKIKPNSAHKNLAILEMFRISFLKHLFQSNFLGLYFLCHLF